MSDWYTPQTVRHLLSQEPDRRQFHGVDMIGVEHCDYWAKQLNLAFEKGRQIGNVDAMLAKINEIVVTEGIDKGVVLLSQEGPTHYDTELKVQVYDHENFSPLGDALIELHDMIRAAKV